MSISFVLRGDKGDSSVILAAIIMLIALSSYLPHVIFFSSFWTCLLCARSRKRVSLGAPLNSRASRQKTGDGGDLVRKTTHELLNFCLSLGFRL